MDQYSPTKQHDRVNVLAQVTSWLINSGLFYLGWVLTIKFVLNGMRWEGPLLNLGIIAIHLLRVPNKAFEALLVLTLPIIGLLFDSSLVFFNILRYEGPYDCCDWIAPLWVSSLWALFATSLNHSLAWAGRNVWMAILTGAIGGTISYLAAIKVGAAHFQVPEFEGVVSLVVAWAIVFPLCFAYNRWLKGLILKFK